MTCYEGGLLRGAWYRPYTARCPGRQSGRMRPARPRAIGPQVGAGLVGAVSGQSRIVADLAGLLDCWGLAALPGLRRQLPAGAPLLR